MLDLGASHNLIPKSVMGILGLDITRTYKYLYTFYAKKAKCLGMIKDVEVNLAQIPLKTILVDVVVSDVLVSYGMLLSRSWGAKLGGALQLDMTNASIPIFEGQTQRLYRGKICIYY